MPHPFQDKLFLFIGRPTLGSRQTARDALSAVGGVTDDTLTTFTDFAVAFTGSEKTKVYKRVMSYERCGLLSAVLSEEQFYGILDGKAKLPDKPDTERCKMVNMIPAERQEAMDAEIERVKRDAIEHKRIKNLAKYGVPTPEGRIKMDFSNLYKARKLSEYLDMLNSAAEPKERCMLCGEPATVFINGEPGVNLKLCIDCNNRQVAGLTGAEVPVNVPKHITLKDLDGVPHTFVIELMMFPVGMTLIAMEDGETRYRSEVFGQLDGDFDELWKSLIRKIEGVLSVKYMGRDGYFKESKAAGYIEYNHERDAHDIIIDRKPYTWQELEKNISAHEGFRIKIEFYDSGDVVE